MAKEVITLKEFRETASLYDDVNPDFKNWSDEVLLKEHLGTGVGLGSLDIVDMVAEIEVEYGVNINSEKFDEMMYPCASEATVQKFLDVCNACVIDK